MTLLYPNGVKFKDPQTGQMATRHWIGLQWGQTGRKPNVLYFGAAGPIPYSVDGGFVITGDVTALTKSVSN